MTEKLGRGCSEDVSKLKTKVDELKAEKRALSKRLRRSQDKVSQLEGLLAKSKPHKEKEEKPRDFETRETETI